MHLRKNSANRAHGAEDVCLENFVHLRNGESFGDAGVAEAGVVDENVYTARLAKDLGYAVADRTVTGDVEFEDAKRFGRVFGQAAEFGSGRSITAVDLAHGRENHEACAGER